VEQDGVLGDDHALGRYGFEKNVVQAFSHILTG
jgi:hypothetical protein